MGGPIKIGNVTIDTIGELKIGSANVLRAYVGNVIVFPSPTPTPSPTPSLTPNPTPTQTPFPTPSRTPDPTPTDAPDPTPTDAPDPTPTDAPGPTTTPGPTTPPGSTTTPGPTTPPGPTTTPDPTETPFPTSTPDPTFNCAQCYNWSWIGEAVPPEGDTIYYYSCSTGAEQSTSVSAGQGGAICNCNSVGSPSSSGTTLTEIGQCV